jgi:uncharacterized protein (DUF1697 family)
MQSRETKNAYKHAETNRNFLIMKYVALLRGINVGGNKKVDMKELKKVFESLGFENVSSYINSGNVIFDAQSPSEKGIEETLEKHF